MNEEQRIKAFLSNFTKEEIIELTTRTIITLLDNEGRTFYENDFEYLMYE